MGKLFVPIFIVLSSYILFCIVIPRIYLPRTVLPPMVKNSHHQL